MARSGGLPNEAKALLPSEEDLKLAFVMLFEENKCLLGKTLRQAEINPTMFKKWMAEDEEFCGQVSELRIRQIEERVDAAEEALDLNVLEGKSSDIKFILETLGKHRGYGKKVEITGPDGRSIFEGLEWPDEPASLEEWEGQVVDAVKVETVKQIVGPLVAESIEEGDADDDTRDDS